MIKTLGAKIYARIIHRRNQKWITNPIEAQKRVFSLLIKRGINTRFGREHELTKIKSQKEFQSAIPIRDYEGLKHYVDARINYILFSIIKK